MSDFCLPDGKAPTVGSSGREELKNCGKQSREFHLPQLSQPIATFDGEQLGACKTLRNLIQTQKKPCNVGSIITSISQLKKLRLRG